MLTRNISISRLVKLCGILLGAVVLLSVYSQSAIAVDGAAAQLTKVENKKVCMVTNKLFEKDQIPVSVEGKTYYGCCEMCKAKLENSVAQRSAVDPISKKQVDKATAVIGAAGDGSVFYFESEENLKKFQP